MRIHTTLAVFIVLSSILLLMNTDHAYGQTDQIATAKTDLVNAFRSIQNAQRQGASNSDILPLVNQLNQAVQYLENATTFEPTNATKANLYAMMSIGISTSVSQQAQRLGNEAQISSTQRSTLAYGISLVAAIVAAVIVIEAPRARRLLANRRFREARVAYQGEKRAE